MSQNSKPERDGGLFVSTDNGPGKQFLGEEWATHLRGVEQGDSELKSSVNRLDRPVSATVAP